MTGTEIEQELTNFQLIKLALHALLIAMSVRLFRRNINLLVPPIENKYKLVGDQLDDIRRTAETFSKIIIFWRRKHCFYRSFIIAYILRQCGMRVTINFGYKNLTESLRNRAHCWLSIDKIMLMEAECTAQDFPVLLGRSKATDIVYWSDD